MAGQIMVQRGHRLVAHGHRLGRRIEKRQQHWQQRDAGGKRDEHAHARYQPQFRQATVFGGQEGEKAKGGRCRSQRQRVAGLSRRLDERNVGIGLKVALFAVAHAKLQPEINAKPDKQHGKSHGNQIERMHHRQAQRRRHRQSYRKANQHGGNDFQRMQRHPQDQQHHRKRGKAVEQSFVCDCCKFLVGQRHRTGQPHAHPFCLTQAKVAHGAADGGGGRAAGFQRGKIQHRLNDDKLAQGTWFGLFSGNQFAPGKAALASRDDIVQSRRYASQGAGER